MESLSAERQEMVHTLMAVAGIDDVEFAREFLQDNGWQLEPSVNAYMMMIVDDSSDRGEEHSQGQGSSSTGAHAPVPQQASRLQSSTGAQPASGGNLQEMGSEAFPKFFQHTCIADPEPFLLFSKLLHCRGV